MAGSDSASGKERRRHERAELKIPVDYSSVDAFFAEFSQNINEGGMFIEMDRPVDLDTPVQLQFRLPGEDRPIQVQGRVAWVSVEGISGTRELHEGDAVGALVVKEIRPSAVVFLHGPDTLQRKVGQRE